MDGVAKDYISNIGCEIYIFLDTEHCWRCSNNVEEKRIPMPHRTQAKDVEDSCVASMHFLYQPKNIAN